MALSGAPKERDRIHAGILVLVGGVTLIVFGWASWMYRTAATQTPVLAVKRVEATRPLDAAEQVIVLTRWLAVGLGLVLIALFGSYVITRAVRRHRASLRRQPMAPTNSQDVWAMHRIPGDREDAERREEGS